METVKVFHIGLGSFGRHGFEKLIELDRHYNDVNVVVEAVCDEDQEKLEAAAKFADSQNVEIETFTDVEDCYQRAEEADSDECNVLIYDAGPSELHAEHIYRSLRKGFFHLAEKPPSLTREDHIKEKKLMYDSEVRFTVDFIERESPVVKKALKITDENSIDSIEVFRESTKGLKKLTNPIDHNKIQGGAVLDKMCHEAFLLDFVGSDWKIENIEKDYMPFEIESDSFMTMSSGKSPSISKKCAESRYSIEISQEDTDLVLNGSWLGCSQRSKKLSEKIESVTDHSVINTDFGVQEGKGIIDEEARFFILEGDTDLVGDMLNDRLFNLETGEEIEVPSLIHDQLYRVLESSVRCAADLENNTLDEEVLDQFMDVVFDVSEYYDSSLDEFEALEKSNDLIRSLFVDHVFEAEGVREHV